MGNFELSNGMHVVFAGNAREYSVCLSVNIGHVNEPKLGLANLFERTLLLQTRGIIPVFGGTMTAYSAGGKDLKTVLQKVAQIFNSTVVSEEYVEQAKKAIEQQTLDIAPLTVRRMKLMYKHTAFGADLVKSTEEYLAAVNSYTVEDVRAFANTYYTASNVVLVIAGQKVQKEDLEYWLEEYFGNVVRGEKRPPFKGNIYTGGGNRIDVEDGMTRLMFGWDAKHLSISDSPTANVMMSMFLRRMERAYAEAGFKDMQIDFKIAGYYGLRTMRAFIMSPTASAKELTDVFVSAVNRICDTEATEERMEKSRNAAMAEKLDKYERSDDKALEMAWQMIGRGSMYNIDSRINSIYETTAHDVRIIAREVFRGSRPTYVVAASPAMEAYSYRELLSKLKLDMYLTDKDV